ncbi:DNA mismatch repair protein Mlh1 [Pseudolycoriella hygida]|uniref:DNA mismatch repair protein Mlh1 n=1 Tax=Pseudolycoriella hygida TaxID=35572 RepID=A0A9Q0N7Z6_9DIPT|nr:DNA mismatch repair protein Mlh1 [Pseudolycoriella hygida]
MYLCNTQKLSEEIFYQILIFDFENFGKIIFDPPLSVRDLAILALKSEQSSWTPKDGPIDDLATKVVDVLTQQSGPLKHYYNLVIKDGMLHSLPLLLEKHKPSLCFLPRYIFRLVTEVQWHDEKEFFKTFSRETAKFYSDIAKTSPANEWNWLVEHVIYPACKNNFMPPQHFSTNKTFLEIASLPNLYKVFERC